MVKAILKNIGIQTIVTAESGKAALDKLRHSNFDLIICDWNMPEMNGIELLKTVRAEWRLDNLPFLMLTAEAYKENISEAMRAGVTDYVVKPFTAETLAKKVVAILVKS
jgi:two-component system chemotaxis response regulator CheY